MENAFVEKMLFERSLNFGDCGGCGCGNAVMGECGGSKAPPTLLPFISPGL
ncbi:MAG: hypothetical protein INR71_04020 [Terriglobus roseus]|nr:hypothetical protein [Terriglobus roseus]